MCSSKYAVINIINYSYRCGFICMYWWIMYMYCIYSLREWWGVFMDVRECWHAWAGLKSYFNSGMKDQGYILCGEFILVFSLFVLIWLHLLSLWLSISRWSRICWWKNPNMNNPSDEPPYICHRHNVRQRQHRVVNQPAHEMSAPVDNNRQTFIHRNWEKMRKWKYTIQVEYYWREGGKKKKP